MVLKHWKLGEKGQQSLTDGNERHDLKTGSAHCPAHWPGSRLHYTEQEVGYSPEIQAEEIELGIQKGQGSWSSWDGELEGTEPHRHAERVLWRSWEGLLAVFSSVCSADECKQTSRGATGWGGNCWKGLARTMPHEGLGRVPIATDHSENPPNSQAVRKGAQETCSSPTDKASQPALNG